MTSTLLQTISSVSTVSWLSATQCHNCLCKCCNVLQTSTLLWLSATRCNTLQIPATYSVVIVCNTLQTSLLPATCCRRCDCLQHLSATLVCNTICLQHVAGIVIVYIMLQTMCDCLQHMSATQIVCNINCLQHVADNVVIVCNTLQHTTKHCNALRQTEIFWSQQSDFRGNHFVVVVTKSAITLSWLLTAKDSPNARSCDKRQTKGHRLSKKTLQTQQAVIKTVSTLS